VLNKLVHNI